MTLLVLGLSHHKAPVDLLERVSADDRVATELERRILAGEHVKGAMVLSTCNRTEVYADALTFHGALSELSAAFAGLTDRTLEDLQPYLYVHYEDRGVAHTFGVAAGLDSMAIGEREILGQLRLALRRAQREGHLGTNLNVLFQQAMRVGKRVHAETGIDTVSRSLVDAALRRCAGVVADLDRATVLVVGAGGMGALAATTCRRRGVGRILVANRGPQRARSLAERLDGEAVDWADLAGALAVADVVMSSTGARGIVIDAELVAAAGAARDGMPQAYVDLALPRDVDPAVGELPHASLMGLSDLGADLSVTGEAPEVQQARDLVTAEVVEFMTMRSTNEVAPTVSALRRRAEGVVAAELDRLRRRLPQLPAREHEEIERTMRRVVDKLLHAPTVRVKEFAEHGQGGSYARVLSELFDLDPREVSLVSAPVLPVLPEGEA